MIKELWRGNIEPIARFSVGFEEMERLAKLKERNRERLSALLNEEANAYLGKYNDCVDEYLCAVCEQAFYEGFCIGTKISVESLSGAEHILKRDCCL